MHVVRAGPPHNCGLQRTSKDLAQASKRAVQASIPSLQDRVRGRARARCRLRLQRACTKADPPVYLRSAIATSQALRCPGTPLPRATDVRVRVYGVGSLTGETPHVARAPSREGGDCLTSETFQTFDTCNFFKKNAAFAKVDYLFSSLQK